MPGNNSLGSFMDEDNFGIQATDTVSKNQMLDFLSSDNSTEEVELDEKPPVEKKKPFVKKASTTTTEETTEAPEQEEKLDLQSALFGEDEDSQEEEKDEDAPETTEETRNEFAIIADTMLGIGVFTKDEGEEELSINTDEELASRFQYEAKKKAVQSIEAFLDRHGEDYRDMFDAVFGNGVHPKDYLEKYAKIVDLTNITPEQLQNEETQEGLVRALYKKEGRSAKSIDEKITKLKNYGDLESEALEAHEILKQREVEDLKTLTQRKADEVAQKQQYQRQYAESVSTILNTKLKDKEFDGIPIDEKFANDTFKLLTIPVGKTPTGETLTGFEAELASLSKPENRAIQIQVAMLLQLVKQGGLSKIGKRAVSKETNKLFNGIQNKSSKTSTGNKTVAKTEPTKWF